MPLRFAPIVLASLMTAACAAAAPLSDSSASSEPAADCDDVESVVGAWHALLVSLMAQGTPESWFPEGSTLLRRVTFAASHRDHARAQILPALEEARRLSAMCPDQEVLARYADRFALFDPLLRDEDDLRMPLEPSSASWKRYPSALLARLTDTDDPERAADAREAFAVNTTPEVQSLVLLGRMIDGRATDDLATQQAHWDQLLAMQPSEFVLSFLAHLDPDRPLRVGKSIDLELSPLGARDEMLRLADWRGRPLTVVFWGAWCAPCRTELAALAQSPPAQDDRIYLLVALDPTPEDSRRFRQTMPTRSDWVDGHADLQVAESTLGFVGVPFVVSLDEEGKVVAFGRTMVDLNQD